MDNEQLKQLKNGDKILIEVIFDQIDDDGDAVIEYANSVSDYERGFISPKYIVDKGELVCPATGELNEYVTDVQETRWKRKNRTAQLKRTIARLSDESRNESRKFHDLWIGEHLKRYSPEWEAFILLRKLQTPADDASTDDKRLYWLDLRKIGGLLLNAACLAAREAGIAEAKEAACLAETAENAKQVSENDS